MPYGFYISRQFLLILLISFNALVVKAQKATDNFKVEWEKVDAFVKKGLTKSALSEADKIYSAAKKSNNEPQLIKALLYKINLNQNIEETSAEKNIDSLERDITTATEPARSILESITAQLYWNYFQQNRYRLYQRTNTKNFDKKDIATWTADDLQKKISTFYLLSVKEKSVLEQINMEPFNAIIIKGNVRFLRPTLYDLLAHRALDYFKSDEPEINRPAYAFEIKDKEAFAPANEFVKHKFLTKDSTSLHQKALMIFQDLLAFHLNDVHPDALIDADIERINFVNQYGVVDDKDTLYMRSLNYISKKYQEYPSSAQATFLVAKMIYNNALQSSENKNNVSDYTVAQAKEILDTIIKKFPDSEGGINSKNLLNQILHPEINLTTEKVNVPDLPFRTLVTYKNFNTIYFRIIELTPELKKDIANIYDNAKVFQKLTNQKSLQTWKQELPSTDDYLQHSTEVKIDALPVGQYVLLGSASPDFSLNKNSLAAAYFYVSNISFINSNKQYFVLDRTTGQPLAGAKVQVYKQRYNYDNRDYQLEKQELITVDKNGYFNLPVPEKNDNRAIRLDINYKNDRLFLDDPQYSYNYYNNDENDDYDDQEDYDKHNAKVFLFTDRSIYRPGQLVYFKGIGVTKDWKTKKPRLLETKDSLTIFLSDANNQNIDSIKVLLNDYGSFNGKFRLPVNKLNGEFEIDVFNYKNSPISFSVEEYKRPKFFTAFEKVKGSYRLGDTVSISGFAKAYAGNNIDGAKVSYRVTRIARFIYPWIFNGRGYPQSNSLEITNGTLTTGINGGFTIRFAAIPDLSLDKNTDPVFDYKVEADVTDINGETRSGDIIIPIGYKALNLQIGFQQEDVINIDSLKNIIVTSKNLSNDPETVKAEIKIYKLQPPKRLIRKRLWNQPDKFVLTKEEYIRYFPHDEYAGESQKENWPESELVYSKSDSTNSLGNWQLKKSDFQQGWYVIEALAKDKFGQDVKNVKYFQAYDKNSDSLPAPSYLWSFGERNFLDPGDTAKLTAGTSADHVFLIQEVDGFSNRDWSLNSPIDWNADHDKTKAFSEFEYFSLAKNRKTFAFPVSENDRGGFGVTGFFVKDNRFYFTSNLINVPWNNKDLNISFETFRDKTLPGSEEKWKVKISGNKGQKVAAEMVASMYDASLDQFKPHLWNSLDVWPTYSGNSTWTGNQNFAPVQSFEKYWSEPYIQQKDKIYDALLFNNNDNFFVQNKANPNYLQGAVPGISLRESNLSDVVVTGYANAKPKDNLNVTDSFFLNKTNKEAIQQPQIQIRKNFDETAFFYPQLRTDSVGDIEFSFAMPEALTQWKLMMLAHTKDLASGYTSKTLITQKDIMVQPDPPRFLREGDSMEFTAKIVNMTNKEVAGHAELQLFSASTMQPVDDLFKNLYQEAPSFAVPAKQSAVLKFYIVVPANFNDAVVYRIVAKSGNISDGEEAAIPVVTNRMLVTESMPLPMRGDGTKDFTFKKLLNSVSSSTLTNYDLTVEYTTNPAWYAIQALPYLMEYPYECAEQTFNRYYANSLATKIVNSSPKIKAVFGKWRMSDTAALLSNLQKNEELKSVLLQETPWVLQAQNEEQQKKNIALLFDMAKMSLQLESALNKLTDMQSPNGGFVWFKGGPDNRYMTQYIITGIGHLKKLNALPAFQENELKIILGKAIPYLDKMLKKDYDDLIKYKSKLNNNNLSTIAIQYLYMRSFFSEYPIANETKTAYNYYREQSKKYWLSQSKYMQAMIALLLNRTNDNTAAKNIVKSLKENSIDNEELGMYWKEWNRGGYWWYQAPIESQAMMIEAFFEIEKDPKTIDDLKTWLLKNKQTNNWETTKATAEACYALLLQGSAPMAIGGLPQEKAVTIQLGNTTFNSKDKNQEAGTGYFKRKIDGDKVTPSMGNILVTISAQKGVSQVSPAGGDLEGASPSWGSIYWQYFENLDKITFSETPLKLSKKLFIEKNSDKGPVLVPIHDGDKIHIGDKIKVRIELHVDRDMEYVHMKDMRASCMEPVNVLSEYKYQDGLGYYETTKDVSTNFFFDHLTKGTYVFEYPMFVTHAGNFSNGITTIQCMYAPEFTSHSEGVRVRVLP